MSTALIPHADRQLGDRGAARARTARPTSSPSDDIATCFATAWKVHYNSSRTGVRLIGPKPRWARPDGGEAGLHPSNIHDNAYAIGTVDFTGDMPIILGPDGPSLGGFVCPATIVEAELWKIGQLKAGDSVRFVPVSLAEARRAAAGAGARHRDAARRTPTLRCCRRRRRRTSPILANQPAAGGSPGGRDPAGRRREPAGRVRPAGARSGAALPRARADERARGAQAAGRRRPDAGHPLAADPLRRSRACRASACSALLAELEGGAARHRRASRCRRASSTCRCRGTIRRRGWRSSKYMQSVRPDAPWCPSNIEFIRRINGLDSIDDVQRIVFDASYLVLGLGDVYLGAPVATPLDPRHRLVTTKYNPARTWTPENAVGIGGAYLCVYGMEGPGGYQFVGRTCQMWNRFRETADVPARQALAAALLRSDSLLSRSSETELLAFRAAFPRGRVGLQIEETTFRFADYRAFLRRERARRSRRSGRSSAPPSSPSASAGRRCRRRPRSRRGARPRRSDALPPGAVAVRAAVTGSVWQIAVPAGHARRRGRSAGRARDDEDGDAGARARGRRRRRGLLHARRAGAPGSDAGRVAPRRVNRTQEADVVTN